MGTDYTNSPRLTSTEDAESEDLGLDEGALAWIMGSSRSGSTWLSRMLCDLARTAVIDDPHLGHHLGVWRPIPLAWAAADHRPQLRTLHEVKADHDSYFFNDRYAHAWRPGLRALIARRFSAEADDQLGSERDLLLVKEPGSQMAGLLLSLFPSSRLIFLVRDGRDVVDSWLDAYQSGSWAIPEGAFPVSPSGRVPLIEWLAGVWRYRTVAVRSAFERHDPERRLIVRYERLLEDREHELLRVAHVCGLERGPALERAIAKTSRRRDFDRLPVDRRGAGRAARAAEPGRWRLNLSSGEQQALIRALGPELDWSLELDRKEVGRQEPALVE